MENIAAMVAGSEASRLIGNTVRAPAQFRDCPRNCERRATSIETTGPRPGKVRGSGDPQVRRPAISGAKPRAAVTWNPGGVVRSGEIEMDRNIQTTSPSPIARAPMRGGRDASRTHDLATGYRTDAARAGRGDGPARLSAMAGLPSRRQQLSAGGNARLPNGRAPRCGLARAFRVLRTDRGFLADAADPTFSGLAGQAETGRRPRAEAGALIAMKGAIPGGNQGFV